MGLPPALLVYAYGSRADRARLDEALTLATRLSPSPNLRAALESVREQAMLDSARGTPP